MKERAPLPIAAALALAALWAALPLPAQTLDDARQLHRAGASREALAAYDRVAEERAATDPAAAAAARNNACVIHNGFGEYEEALRACEQALTLRRGLGDELRLARTLNNLAIPQQNLGDYDGARSSLLEALEINTRLDDPLARVLNLSNLGALATLRGRYGEALELHLEAGDLAAAHAEKPWSAEQRVVATINRGVVLERLGAFREALELYRGLVQAPPTDLTDRRRAQLKLNSGVIYRNLGDPVRAVREFEEVAAIFRELQDPDGLSNALLNLGLALHLDLERWPEAEAAYREALAIATRHDNRPEMIQDLFYLGHFLLERGRLAEAERMYERCLEVAEASGSTEGRWSALSGLGDIAAARGDLALAARRLGEAIDQIETVGAGLGEPSLAGGFFGEKRPVYAAAAQVEADRHRADPDGGHDERAFSIAQRAKARALLDALGDRRWIAAPLTAEELADGGTGRPLLEYFLAERDLLRWTLGPGGLEMSNLGPAAGITERTLRLYRLLEEGEAPPPELVGDLAADLLSGARLESVAPGGLHVAPDGLLDRLPFEMLPLTGEGAAALGDRFDVSYVPSASTLVWLRERRSRRGGPDPAAVALRGFAAPELPLDDKGSAIARIGERFSLPPLPAAAAGLETLALRIPGRRRLHTGGDANEDVFRATAPESARIVHLATHTVVDERPGRGAAVLLAPGAEHDGILEPREIAGLDHRARLTVLASCRSALESGSGGSLSALTGAFLAAGSEAVVATLWDVGDTATAAFMEQFYYRLGRGAEPAVALAETKRRLRRDRDWGAPHLWAGYVLVGEAPAVAPRRFPGPRAIGVGGLLIAAVLIALAWRLRPDRLSRRRE
ncbi:MAG: CHAT domain-containing tetratricopeptide repeat protein [Thermoanaerobaculia bacterium]|nr:CHAT domain-containing tetratricopeptide repeat protein [Thermoanaerobaculia bacterium]